MEKIEIFEFDRSRGIVWVCDIKNSTNYLNNELFIDKFEEFLKRFYWLSTKIVKSADGLYIKWTGDGFLSWFECPIKRKTKNIINVVLTAAHQLSVLVNITKLGIETENNITLRHGIAFEEDAVKTYIENTDLRATDVLGRNIVLAFRLSGIDRNFPNILVQSDLIDENCRFINYASKIVFSDEEISKYFKGEKYLSENVTELNIKNISKNDSDDSSLNKLKKIINVAERRENNFTYKIEDVDSFNRKLLNSLEDGPNWANEVKQVYSEHALTMYKLIKEYYSKLKEADREST